jgi:hypothetical protein
MLDERSLRNTKSLNSEFRTGQGVSSICAARKEDRVSKLVVEYPSFFEGVIPTVAQRSGGICFSTGTLQGSIEKQISPLRLSR